jgi:selenocysteine lyase/cysteine desulfurase
MLASMELLLEAGIEAVGTRILELRRALLEAAKPLGYRLYADDADLSDAERSGIVSLVHPDRDIEQVAARLKENGVVLSLRRDREGRAALRFSPHFYNTPEEMDRVAHLL